MANSTNKFKKALCLNKRDNIVISLQKLCKGEFLDDFNLSLHSDCLPGQKIVLKDIKINEPIIKYATTIGFADDNLKKGQVLNNSNVIFKEFKRNHNFCIKYKPTRFSNNEITFEGFKRGDGTVGTRNFISVVSTVNCSATVVHEIASYFNKKRLKKYPNVDGVAAFSHSTGCGWSKLENQCICYKEPLLVILTIQMYIHL